MSSTKKLIALLVCTVGFVVGGCQTLDSRQYDIASVERSDVVAIVASIAASNEMNDCTAGAKAIGAIVCYRKGDTSFTFVGVRDVGGRLVIDLAFRSAGMGGDLYKTLSAQIVDAFKMRFGPEALREVPPRQVVPIEHASS